MEHGKIVGIALADKVEDAPDGVIVCNKEEMTNALLSLSVTNGTALHALLSLYHPYPLNTYIDVFTNELFSALKGEQK